MQNYTNMVWAIRQICLFGISEVIQGYDPIGKNVGIGVLNKTSILFLTVANQMLLGNNASRAWR